MKIGITAGAMDLLHTGHILMLEECSKFCDYLIVCLHVDPSSERPEKNKPIQSVFERHMQLRACKYVDEIIVYETERELLTILETINVDIRFIGEDWKNKDYTGKDLEIPTYFNKRTHDYSSTELRKRIIGENNVK